MAVQTAKSKDPAAVALGRKGGRKGGPARAAKLTPKQRSDSARRAVQARWAKVKRGTMKTETSDQAVLALLERIKTATSQTQIRKLSNELERVIFHKQYANA